MRVHRILHCFLLIVGILVAAWTVGLAGEGGDSLGMSIYRVKCAGCHGMDGRGKGPESALLHPKPRDFTSGVFKFRTTESGSIPTDEDSATTVKNGLPGSSMPRWGRFISDDSIKTVVAYVKSSSPRFRTEHPTAVLMGKMIPSFPSSIAQGKKVFEQLQCASCHGTDGRGTDAIASNLTDDWSEPICPTNLDEPWNFRGGSTARDIFLRFRTGIEGTPMPSYAGTASETEMWNLANYVVSLARKPVWMMNADELKSFYRVEAQRSAKDPLSRGEYLVHSLGCAHCHSPFAEDGGAMREMLFAGGQKWDLYPFGVYVTYNLTSDKETGLGSWTDEQIKKFVTTGVRRDGSRMLPFPMPWTSYAHLTQDDLSAVVAYLRTIPPIYNEIPPPRKLNVFSYLWGKFRGLILHRDDPGFSYPGNAGQTKSDALSENHVSKEGR